MPASAAHLAPGCRRRTKASTSLLATGMRPQAPSTGQRSVRPASPSSISSRTDASAMSRRSCLVSRRLGAEQVTVLECGRCAGFWIGHEAFRQLVERAQREALPAWTILETPQQVAAQVANAKLLGLGDDYVRTFRERITAVSGQDVS